MSHSRYLRRLTDSGLQPERTALSWKRTLLVFMAFIVLFIRKQNGHFSAVSSFLIGLLLLVLLLLWICSWQRSVMDSHNADFSAGYETGSKLALTIILFGLSAFFAVTLITE